MRALITLYGPETKRNERIEKTVELARAQEKKLAVQVRHIRASEEASLRARMERIAEIRKRSPEQSRAMYESVIVLYGDYAWAQPFIEQAKRAVQELPEPGGDGDTDQDAERGTDEDTGAAGGRSSGS